MSDVVRSGLAALDREGGERSARFRGGIGGGLGHDCLLGSRQRRERVLDLGFAGAFLAGVFLAGAFFCFRGRLLRRCLLRGRLGVLRLEELDFDAAGDGEVGDPAVAVVGDVGGELDAAGAQVGDGPLDVVAVERQIVGAGGAATHGTVGGVNAQVAGRKIEDQPALTDVGAGELELITQEVPRRLCL